MCVQVQALGGDAAVDSIALGPIPHPAEEGAGGEGAQAAAAVAAAIDGRQTQRQQQPIAARQGQERRRPAAVLGDGVAEFSEIAVAAGALGRFPGSGIMPLVRQFIGLEAVS